MSMHGLRATVRLESLELGKGIHNSAPFSDTEMKFQGTITSEVGKNLFAAGIADRAGIGSSFSCAIEFGNRTVGLPDELNTECIGWMEVHSSEGSQIADPDPSSNPVHFNLRINLPRTDLPDLIAIGSHPVLIEPVFHYVGDRKLTTTKTGGTVMFYIQRVWFYLILPKSDDGG